MTARMAWMGLIVVSCLLSVNGAFAAEHTKDSLAVVKQKLADKSAVPRNWPSRFQSRT